MVVLESITSYVENVKRNSYIYDRQKEALRILYKYCHNTEPQMNLCDVDGRFFDEFLMYWLPKNESRLREWEVSQVLQGVGDYCNYIQSIYNIPSLEKYEIMKEYRRECLRIYQLKHLLLKYLGDPILDTDPLIVDFKAYKKYKIKKDFKRGQGVYQQGLYQVVEIDYDNTIVLQRISKGPCVRVILTDALIAYIRKGDILHLRIKQRQFFVCWEIVDLKGCYLANASQYLMN